SAVVPARPRPRGRGMGRLYRVPDVLAIPLRDLGEERARRAQDLPAIALVGTDLLASDEEFVSPINGRERGAGSGSLHGLASRGSQGHGANRSEEHTSPVTVASRMPSSA